MSFLAHESAHLDEHGLERARRRTRWALFASVALGSTGHLAAVTVAAIVGQDLLGTAALAGAPGAAVVFGAAVGAIALSSIMARRGRRLGLTTGYLLGIVGALIATEAVLIRSFPLLLLGTFIIGFGNSSNNLSRYAAADLVAPNRRAVAIGLVVWGSTVGGIVGPWLAPIAGNLALGAGLPQYAGPFLVPVLFVGAAALLTFVFLRPDPFALAHETNIRQASDAPALPAREIFARPAVLAALVALMAGQATMVLIMTMTPLHLTSHNHGLETVGLVISGHVAGMFALAPLSGWISQRIGNIRTIFLGTAVLAGASLLAGLAPPEHDEILFVALFLLGWGWNLGFVAGSAMLSAGVELAARARVQGLADAAIWTTSAIASLGSGAVVAAAGFSTLGFLGVALVLAPVWLLLTRRHVIAAGTAN
ncbi:MAG TPA: MFS transporter [Candidatus Limnocylindrales bacterium]|jgi:predicted MFS family arabinose efflux permease